MAKPAKKKVAPTSGAPVKSKKPKFPGLNHIPDLPKGFRSDKKFMKLIAPTKGKRAKFIPGTQDKNTEEN